MKVTAGVLTDMSSLYKDNGEPGSVEVARMAAEDFHPDRFGMTVRIVSADRQNKEDVGSAIARRRNDAGGLDAIVDVPGSAVALAVSNVTRGKSKVLLISSAGHSNMTAFINRERSEGNLQLSTNALFDERQARQKYEQ